MLPFCLSSSSSTFGMEWVDNNVKLPSWGTRGGWTGIGVILFLRVLLWVVALRFTFENISLALWRLSKLLHSLSVSEYAVNKLGGNNYNFSL